MKKKEREFFKTLFGLLIAAGSLSLVWFLFDYILDNKSLLFISLIFTWVAIGTGIVGVIISSILEKIKIKKGDIYGGESR